MHSLIIRHVPCLQGAQSPKGDGKAHRVMWPLSSRTDNYLLYLVTRNHGQSHTCSFQRVVEGSRLRSEEEGERHGGGGGRGGTHKQRRRMESQGGGAPVPCVSALCTGHRSVQWEHCPAWADRRATPGVGHPQFSVSHKWFRFTASPPETCWYCHVHQ